MKGSSKFFILVTAIVCVWFFCGSDESAEVRASAGLAKTKSFAISEVSPKKGREGLQNETEGSEEPHLLQQSAMSLSDFSELSQATQKALPTLQDFKSLSSKEAHTTPLIIQQAGSALGKVAQALSDNPHFAAEAAQFYRDCFARINLPDQIRALCLANHRNLRLKNGDRAEWTGEETTHTTDTIQNLAKQIPF